MKILTEDRAIWLAKFMVRYERGGMLIGFITRRLDDFKNAFITLSVIAGWIYILFGVEIRDLKWLMIALGIFGFVVIIIKWIASYLIGLWDEKKGFWKIQNRYNTETLNPFFMEMSEDIKKIKEKI